MTITNATQLKSTCRNAELTASLLRQPGFHRLGQTERERIATMLDDLARVCRTRYHLTDDVQSPPTLYDAAHDDDDGAGDLFGVPAA